MTITGRAVALRGEDVDTDRIMPARFLRAVSFDGLEAHVFEDDRRAGAAAGQGSPTGRTLLMSPAMVAAAAVAGEVTDVRRLLRHTEGS